MSLEEKDHSQQDSGRKKGLEYFRLDRQKVNDFFLSIESDKDVGTLKQATKKNKKEVKEDKSADFFLPE